MKKLLKDNKGLAPIFIFAIIAILAAAAASAGIYYFQKAEDKKMKEETEKQVLALKKKEEEKEKEKSEFTPIDDQWIMYKNKKLGFSIKVPKENLSFEGACKWVGGDDNSYRPDKAMVPVTFFEEKETAWITNSFYYQLGGETKKQAGVGTTSHFSKCDKTTINLSLLNDESKIFEKGWKITAKTVSDEEALKKVIKENYGSGCNITTKKESSQAGVFDVGLKSTWPDESCPINFAYVLKYSPDKKKAIFWNTGQSNSFWDKNQQPLDDEMLKSFKFE